MGAVGPQTDGGGAPRSGASGSPDRSGTSGSPDRGQTTTDFAIGAGVFLLAVAFTFAFVPGMFDPFVGGPGQDRIVVADRVAGELANGVLGGPGDPYELEAYELDPACTTAFFRQVRGGSHASAVDCGFDTTASADTVGGALDLESLERVNVTVRGDEDGDGDREIVCRDGAGTGATVLDCSDGSAVGPLTAGDPPSDTSSVVAAGRLVSIDDGDGPEIYRIAIRVW